MSRASLQQTYEDTPYLSLPYFEASVDHLEIVARSRGVEVAPSDGARVLEIGCSSGGNLIPMATRFPKSRFVGLDFSSEQVLLAKEKRRELSLKNIFFVNESFAGYQPPEGEKFDYIIAHGVLSWIPLDQRPALFEAIQKSSHEKTVVYMSYNCFPGAHIKNYIRDLLLFAESLSKNDPKQNELVGFVEQMIESSKIQIDPRFVQGLRTKAWPLLLHDELELENHALHFSEFEKLCQNYGLHYLCDSLSNGQHSLRAFDFPEGFKSIEGLSVTERETLADQLGVRAHRNSICVFQKPGERRGLQPEVLEGAFFQSALKEGEDSIFANKEVGRVRAEEPSFHSFLKALEEAYPSSKSWAEIRSTIGELSPEKEADLKKRVLKLFSGGVIRMLSRPVVTGASLSEKPHLRKDIVFFESGTWKFFANSLHRPVFVMDETLELLKLCDGTREIDEIKKSLPQTNVEPVLKKFFEELIVE